ncbi:hypothetical protein BME69_21215 [Klebsiella quasipneumoniae subsp. quasipneumoniae]|nr:hypothetical protein BME39_04515 [Klebsiella quasipneumoniae subsp. similipneumoniae]OVY29950.1 hypothetical protein BME69_21215 [Klebsiella quasipneumoniae subsp. quasipneumoniae]
MPIAAHERTVGAPFAGTPRQKRANSYDKFRRRSQLQNYILPLHNLSSLITVHPPLSDTYSLIMHFM